MSAPSAVAATKEMCFLCFEALENKVTGQHNDKVATVVCQSNSPVKTPLFVTWTEGEDLRGCIGNFSPLPIFDGLKEYAVIAGTQDHRFAPIAPKELSELTCGISLLHSFEDKESVMDWDIGTHGIRLFIEGYSATFLPEVAPEQNWSKDETLQHLARKGGYRGQLTKDVLNRAKIQRYQSSKIKATWKEYQDFITSH